MLVRVVHAVQSPAPTPRVHAGTSPCSAPLERRTATYASQEKVSADGATHKLGVTIDSLATSPPACRRSERCSSSSAAAIADAVQLGGRQVGSGGWAAQRRAASHAACALLRAIDPNGG